jgi:predicted nucleic acid-binding protein
VKDELSDPDKPLSAREWMADPPAWVEVRHTMSPLMDASLRKLGAGETEAITLATELHADVLLMDNRREVTAAIQRGLVVTGTMGLPTRAPRQGIPDLADAFERLKRTNFRYRQEIMDAMLKEASAGS